MVSQYKNMMSVQGKGLQNMRIFNIAVVDIIATIILGIIVDSNKNSLCLNMPLEQIIGSLLGLSVIVNRVFGVDTSITKLLFKTNGVNQIDEEQQ
jgi:hypothetical protein